MKHKYLHDLQTDLWNKMRLLTLQGALICDNYTEDNTSCKKCRYSQYWHLVKQVLSLEKE